jgi:hypothetical protein
MKYRIAAIFALLTLAMPAAAFSGQTIVSGSDTNLRHAGDRSGECGPVTPRVLKDLCNRYQTNLGVAQCFAAGKDAFLDKCGLGICDTYKSENGTTGCIRAIRDRRYSIDDITACNRITTENETTLCMGSVGTSSVNHGVDTKYLLNQIDRAIDYQMSNQPENVRLILESMRSYLISVP